MSLLIILFCFFLSGFSGLVYEVVWSRQLVHVFGSSLQAVSAAISVFMAGLALGAYLGSLMVSRYKARHPLVMYAMLELGIAGSASLVTCLLSASWLDRWSLVVHQLPGGVQPAVIAFPALLVPTFLMGAELPTLTRYAVAAAVKSHRAVNRLYVASTFGAAFGALFAGFALIPHLGLSWSVYVGCLLNLVAATGSFLVWRIPVTGMRNPEAAHEVDELPTSQGSVDSEQRDRFDLTASDIRVLFGIVLLSAILSMVLEVVWIRLFSLILGASVYAVSLVLSVFLLALAFGSVIAHRFWSRFKEPLLPLSALLFAGGCCLYLSLFAMSGIASYCLHFSQFLEGIVPGHHFAASLLARAVVAAALIGIPVAALGAVFPLVVRLQIHNPNVAPVKVGRLYATSTVGTVSGACIAGFVLIPGLSKVCVSGMQATLVIGSWAFFFLSGFSWYLWRKAPGRIPPAYGSGPVWLSLCLMAVMVVVVHPNWQPSTMSSGYFLYRSALPRPLDESPVKDIWFYREGYNTVVSVEANDKGNVTVLKNDGKVEGALPSCSTLPAPTSDVATQVLLGQIPLLICRQHLKRALLIGYGTGTTAGAMLREPSLQQLTVAELEEAVYAADRFFHPSNNHPLSRARVTSGLVRPLVVDGRAFLRSGQDRFDVIVSQPAEPWVSGSCDLYTKEFFRRVRSRLSDGGLFCQWVQLYSITPRYLGVLCRTFLEEFPDTLVFHPGNAGEIILVGSTGPYKIDVSRLSSDFYRPETHKLMLKIGYHSPQELLSCLVQGPFGLAASCRRIAAKSTDDRINTDDRLILEYELPKCLPSEGPSIEENLKLIESPTMRPESMLVNFGDCARSRSSFLSRLAVAYCNSPLSGDFVRPLSDLAVSLATKAVDICDSVETRLGRAKVWMNVKNTERCKRDVGRGLKLTATTYGDCLALGRYFFDEGKYLSSRFWTAQALTLNSNSVEARTLMGYVLLRQGQAERAADVFASLVPTAGGCTDSEPRFSPGGHCHVTACRSHSRSMLKFGATKGCFNLDVLNGLALANLCLRANAVADELLRYSLYLDPGQFDARLLLGRSLCDSGHAEEGLRQMVASSLQCPENASPYWYVSLYYARIRDWDTARANLELYFKHSSRKGKADLLAFVILRALGRQEADGYLERYLEHDAPERSTCSPAIKKLLGSPLAAPASSPP